MIGLGFSIHAMHVGRNSGSQVRIVLTTTKETIRNTSARRTRGALQASEATISVVMEPKTRPQDCFHLLISLHANPSGQRQTKHE